MNLDKLKVAQINFLAMYPGAFENLEMQEMSKRHMSDKIYFQAAEFFAKPKFEDPNEIVSNMVKIVSRSTMVSLFEKPKFRDFVNSLDDSEKKALAKGLQNFLYKDEEKGFVQMVDVLKKGKIAKWSLLTALFFYFRPQEEVFIKPTTTKGVIEYFEIENLKYSPSPTYAFYKAYRELIKQMKSEVDASLYPNNAAFSGFLMMSLP